MSEFLTFLPPPGETIYHYDRTKPSNEQHGSIPAVFKDVMAVREEVFVKEQSVPLENELDADDPRSYHWVAYASVSSTSKHSSNDQDARKPSSTKLPVGTIRLVPPPHPPHPEPESEHKIDNAEDAPAVRRKSDQPDNIPTYHHDGVEPYVKLGRLATLSAYRGLGLSRLLVNGALEYASSNPETVCPRAQPAEVEKALLVGQDADTAAREWKGLILVHAQEHLEKFWGRYGFVRDKGMAVWDEEGIRHIGMWRRVEKRRGSGDPPVGTNRGI